MVTNPLPADIGLNIPDIAALLAGPIGSPLPTDDYARILRVLLREGLTRMCFISLFGTGYLHDQAIQSLPAGYALSSPVIVGHAGKITGRDLALPLDIPLRTPQNGGGALRFFLVVSLQTPISTIVLLEPLPNSLNMRLRNLASEREFFAILSDLQLTPAQALRAVYNTLWTAATAETPDRVEPLTTRLERIDEKIAGVFSRRGLSW